MSRATIKVNPDILVWARKERGYEDTQAAAKLDKDIAVIREWEKTGENITFAELKKIATTYKRQVSVFFLTEVPRKTKIPKERRNLRVDERGLAPETLLAVRQTNRYLRIARELSDNHDLTVQYQGLGELLERGKLVNAASKLREQLGITLTEQKKCNDASGALRMWRQAIESKLGIYTFQLLMPENELDGFSYVEEGVPYAITLNSRTAKNRQMFTLFHELGHIVEGSSGICLTTNTTDNSNNIEVRCNRFAADFLMPADAMKVPSNFDELKTLAREMCVSAEAYAIRAFELKSIDGPTLDVFLERIVSSPKKAKSNKELSISPVVMSKSRRGDKFFNLVIDAYGNGRISATAVADILGIRPTRIDRK